MAGFMIPLSFSRISVSQKTPISFVIPGSLRSIVNKSCHALQNSSSCSSCSVKKLVPVFVFSKWAALTSLQSRPFRAFMDPRPQVLGSFISKASFASMAGGSAAEKEKEFRAQADGIPGLRLTVWDQQDLTPKFPKIDRDESADVVVVGAGIAGLSVAYNLVKEGKSVVVLEAKTLGSGQTGRTTAHIMLWFDDFYYKIEKDHGLEIAKLVADSHKKAIDFVENTTKEEGIDCHFCRLDGYLFPHDDSAGAMDIILKEFEACKRAGLDVSMVDLGDDPAHGRAGKAIRFPRCADFHPLLYIKGLADAIVRRGGKIYEQSHVFNTEQNKVSTTEGVTVSAQAVVMATNSPLSHNLAVHARQTAYRTYVVGFKVPKGSVKKANWWDTADPYHYVRLESKPDCDVLIVGGEDTDSGMKPSDFPDPYSALEKWTRQRWATAGEVLYKWTGQWYDPVDYLYHIGLNPVQRDHYLITGDSGQGMTGGTIGGILIKDMILHRNNPWEIAYDPGRRPPISMKTGKNAAHEASRTIHGYKDHIPGVGADSIDIEDMQTRSGAVIEKGKKKFAIYKDDNGVIHKYSAICPHMNCIVKWNPIDSTFDCPCHGSMFDNLGRCINGPAKADLFPED